MSFGPFKEYETEEDRRRQEKLITFLSRLWNFEAVDQGKFAVIDYHCYRNKVLVALIEIKHRFGLIGAYPTYICTCKDIDFGVEQSQKLIVPFILVVQFNDVLGYFNIKHNDYPMRRSGQKNRNDPNDALTMCYLIPTNEFIIVRRND